MNTHRKNVTLDCLIPIRDTAGKHTGEMRNCTLKDEIKNAMAHLGK